jgi:hypothetical protein
MNVKESCACTSTFELHDEIMLYDTADAVTAKRERFEAKLAAWEARHAPCLEAWRERVKKIPLMEYLK